MSDTTLRAATQDMMTAEQRAAKRERDRRYRNNNPEKIADKNRRYNEANPQRRAEYKAQWHRINAAKKSEQDRLRYKANRERNTDRNRRNMEELVPSVVAALLRIPVAHLSPELYALKREQILNHRALKELKAVLKEKTK